MIGLVPFRVRLFRAPAFVTAVSWLPLIVLPSAALVIARRWTPWLQMWALAIATYAAVKWMTFRASAVARRASLCGAAAYLLLWPGMDADAFCGSRGAERPEIKEWLAAMISLATGMAVFLVLPVSVAARHPIAAGLFLVGGMMLVLHFGLFRLLSLIWRSAGVDAAPIMKQPVFAASLADFWSRRWNLAFRDAAHRRVFRPLVPIVGCRWAMAAVFIVSGVVHDLVISVPARAGLGLPMLYFAIQGAALGLERSRLGRSLGLGRGAAGRVFAAVAVLLPVLFLFHPAFLSRVMIPMFRSLHEVMP
jgi:hypothetical protein